jgi:hypothetical protein
MIIEVPNENSIVKWKNDEKDEWKVAEISDLIKAYERPHGDLISRDALRKDIEHLYSIYAENKDWFYTDVLNHIDNAPTVEAYSFERVQELVKLNQQFAQEIENLKRPQGEWIEKRDSLGHIQLYCNQCDAKAQVGFISFCGKCGAKMKGGAE